AIDICGRIGEGLNEILNSCTSYRTVSAPDLSLCCIYPCSPAGEEEKALATLWLLLRKGEDLRHGFDLPLVPVLAECRGVLQRRRRLLEGELNCHVGIPCAGGVIFVELRQTVPRGGDQRAVEALHQFQPLGEDFLWDTLMEAVGE